tara:strand:- start:1096 stop:2406 length:1311 start_codon:yes stop_codon:yes gene_type:complete
MNIANTNLFNNRFLAALKFRDYRILWTANLCAGASSWALIVTRGWVIYEATDNSFLVGLVTFLAMIPRIIMPPISGYFADKYDRKNVMSILFGVSVIHTLALSIYLLNVEISSTNTIIPVMVLALIDGSTRASQQPVGQALVPNLVPKENLLNAVALGQATFHGSRLIGPLAILPLLSFVSIGWSFLLCSILYLISLIQTIRIKSESSGSMDKDAGLISNFTKGIPYIYKHPQLRLIMFMAFFHCGFTMSFESVLPVISDKKFGASEGTDFSLIMMAVGAGALITVTLISGLSTQVSQGRWYLYLGYISSISPIFLAFSPNITIALISAALMGGSQAGYMTITHTMMQIVTDDSVRGRVAAMYNVHIGFIMSSMNLVNGALATISYLGISVFFGLDLIPAGTLLTVGGLLFLITISLSPGLKTLRSIYKVGIPYSS